MPVPPKGKERRYSVFAEEMHIRRIGSGKEKGNEGYFYKAVAEMCRNQSG
jgi:hypothetical protein